MAGPDDDNEEFGRGDRGVGREGWESRKQGGRRKGLGKQVAAGQPFVDATLERRLRAR